MSKVIKSVGKVIKKIVKSKVFKVVLIAAAIYLGGAALGAWNSAFPAVNGALVQGGATAGAGSGAALGASTTSAAAGGVNATALAGGSSTATGFSAGGITSTAAGNALPAAANAGFTAGGVSSTVAGTGSVVAPGVAAGTAAGTVATTTAGAAGTAAAKTGIISQMMSGGLKFAADNPIPAAMMVSGIAGAGSPDEIDLMREQQKRNDEDRERREENTDVSDITMPKYRQAELSYNSTGQDVFNGGLINGRRLAT